MRKKGLFMIMCAVMLCFGCQKADKNEDTEATSKQEESVKDDKEADGEETNDEETEEKAEKADSDGDNYSPITTNVKVDLDNEYPYEIRVNRALNCVTIYGADDTGKYTLPVMAMICSTGGEQTPLGTYQLGQTSRWQMNSNNEFSQYATRIVDDVSFQSAPYYSENNNDLNVEQFNKMGETIDGSSIQLETADAKWIAKNCPEGTKVEIYDNAAEVGPLGKPEARVLNEDQTKDPTDSAKNEKKDVDYVPLTIEGVEDKVVTMSQTYNWLEGVSAKDSKKHELTALVQVFGQVDVNTVGDYKLVYVCTNKDNETREVACNVKVVEGDGSQVQQAAEPESTPQIQEAAVNTPQPAATSVSNETAATAQQAPAAKATTTPSNSSSVVVTTVIDKEPPSIEITAKTRFVTDISLETLEKRVVVSDNSGRLSEFHVTTQSVPQNPYSYIVIYEAVDEAGNYVCISETVIVSHQTNIYVR